MKEYEIIGRANPSESDSEPQLFKMRIFAPNSVVAKSRFFYFLRKLKKIKRSNGEVVSIEIVEEENPLQVKNYGVWIRYDSRTGTHNMYKEYREMCRADAIKACYQDMASKHRSRFSSIQIINIIELTEEQVKRPYIKQLLDPEIKFPILNPHKCQRSVKGNLFVVKQE